MTTHHLNGREIHCEYWRKPIPTDGFDWVCTYDDYDGAPDSHHPMGFGRTKEDAIADLLEREDE